MYDLIIVGMGISGITAGIYAKRANMNVLLMDKMMPGGMLNNIDVISNYPGLVNIKGVEFASNLFDQVKMLEIPYRFEEVLNIVDGDIKKVITNKEEYSASKVIIATGSKPKFLGLENEKELLGKGISTCAICDGPLYKDKVVAVVGNGNSALQESLYLANICKKVYILNKYDYFKADIELVNKVNSNNVIEIVYDVNIKSYNENDNKISSVTLDNDEIIDLDGVFIYIGYAPNTEVFKDLNILNEKGYVIVDNNFETNIKGIYAIGDVIEKEFYQLITAASDAVTVIKDISKKAD